jgi:hypothetical protein
LTGGGTIGSDWEPRVQLTKFALSSTRATGRLHVACSSGSESPALLILLPRNGCSGTCYIRGSTALCLIYMTGRSLELFSPSDDESDSFEDLIRRLQTLLQTHSADSAACVILNVFINRQINNHSTHLIYKSQQINTRQARGILGTIMCKSFCCTLLRPRKKDSSLSDNRCTPSP